MLKYWDWFGNNTNENISSFTAIKQVLCNKALRSIDVRQKVQIFRKEGKLLKIARSAAAVWRSVGTAGGIWDGFTQVSQPHFTLGFSGKVSEATQPHHLFYIIPFIWFTLLPLFVTLLEEGVKDKQNKLVNLKNTILI